MTAHARETHSLDGIAFQLAMAFGQGTGTMLASEAALKAAFDRYRDAIAALLEHDGATVEGTRITWESEALRTIEYGRALGKLSAHLALSEGRIVIDVEDVERALRHLQMTGSDVVIGACRITGQPSPRR